MSPRVQLAVLLLLAVPQFYFLPKSIVDLALTTIVAMLLLADRLYRLWLVPRRPLESWWLLGVLIGLLVIRIVALAWSPTPRDGLQPAALVVQFIVTLIVATAALREDPKLLTYVQRFFWPFVGVEAVLVVFFRLVPDVEHAFLRSIGGFFAGQKTAAALFADGPNNVLDPTKAGGVFVNANVAAMFLGVSGLAALALFAVTRTRWVAAIGILALVATLFTGSKLAKLLAFVLPIFAIGTYYLTSPAIPKKRRYLIFGALAVAFLAVFGVIAADAGLRDQMIEAFVGRTAIWGFGAESFQDNPILGLGYGGWDGGMREYAATHGIYRALPPHNILLAAWSVTGIVGLLLTVAYFGVLIWLVLRNLSVKSSLNRGFVAFAGAAIAWIVIHGMGENTDIFGEIHLIPVLALLLAFLSQPIEQEAAGNASPAQSRYRATSAVPPVGNVHREPGDGPAQFPPPVRGEGPGDPAWGRLGQRR